MIKKVISFAVLGLMLAGCPSESPTTYGSDGFAEETLVTTPTLNDEYLLAAAPKYYIGNAYRVEDVQYVPMEDLSYNQTGVAGIIPTELNGTKTSNGEIFDASRLVATSKTLPLPSIARVTNLDNGESVVVRVNNRGPFVNTRIMDLSPEAARKIGITSTAKVQIQVLADQSTAVKNATLGTSTTAPMTTAENVPAATVSTAAPVAIGTGDYAVQVAAFYAEDSATALAQRMQTYGNASVVHEGDMYKVRITGLDAASARQTIDTLRASEGMAPGLLQNGRWVNADSI